MAVDLEVLLAPVSDDAPAGPDLAYDPQRAEIEQAFERPPSIDVTGAETSASDVDWRKIIGMIQSQSVQTKDIWLAVYLCRAGAWSGDLELVLSGAQYLAGLCERFWDTVHPQLDEYGFQGRKGPCESLASVGAFLTPLRRITLLAHPRLGAFTGADFERFRANAEAEEGYGLFRAALNDTPEEVLVGTFNLIEGALQALKRVDVILTAQAEGDTGPNFQSTYDVLQSLKRGVLAFVTTPQGEEAEEGSAADAESGVSAPSGGGARIAGRVESREDVLKALDAISDYYRRREPASPVPLLLQRAREWTSLDFLAVLKDIAPSALTEAQNILNFRTE